MMTNKRYRRPAGTQPQPPRNREYKIDELVAVDLCALWNPKGGACKRRVWRNLGDRFLVLPSIWMDDLLKHHAAECQSRLRGFLDCLPSTEKILVARSNETARQYELRALSSVCPSDAYEPPPDLEEQVRRHNDEATSRYLESLAKGRSEYGQFLESVSDETLQIFSRLRTTDEQSQFELEVAGQTVGQMLRQEIRPVKGYGDGLNEQRVNLAFCVVLLREHEGVATAPRKVLNDIYDLDYLILGADLSDLWTEDRRLWKAHQVYKHAAKALRTTLAV